MGRISLLQGCGRLYKFIIRYFFLLYIVLLRILSVSQKFQHF